MQMTLSARIRQVVRDRRGVAMLEFALALPIIVPIGLYGVELSNFGLQQIRLSQAAMTLADNISRVGADTSLATQQLREVDINEVIDGLRQQTAGLQLTTHGRVTISSIEMRNGAQWIHWQRCVGLQSGPGYDSSFGHEDEGGTSGTSFRGMGNPSQPVTAPANASVIFVEINYDYTPLITRYFVGQRKLQQVASFIARDNRDLVAGITDPAPSASVRMTCDRYSS